MSEAKHTPGPWDVNGIDTEKIRIGSRKMSDVAIVYNQPNRFDGSLSKSRKRNAELIAAAPDLLAACEAAIEQIEALDDVLNQSGHEVIGWHLNGDTEPIASFFQDNDIGAVEKLRAAIAKAKGQTA
jgi:hypothetical protein